MPKPRTKLRSKSKSKLKSKPKSLPVDQVQSTQTNIQRYLPYLKEIQQKLLVILIVFLVGASLGFIYYQNILSKIMNIFSLDDINIVLTSPYQFINLSINTGLITGLLAAIPFLIYYFLKFTQPALRPKEYKLIVYLLPFSAILFIVGFGFGIWVIQFVIAIFSKTSQEFAIGNIWDISHFLSQVLFTGTSLAIVFQLPIILTALLRLKVVKYQSLIKQRRIVYAILLIFAAILPPTDLISLSLLVSAPLFLFELALLFNRPTKIT